VDVPQSKTDPLYLLADAFRSQNIATYIEVVSGAKIPIVKFDHVSGVSVDVLCNNRDGIQTAKLMKKYVREFPPLKPLTVLLKIFLVSPHLLSFFPSLSPVVTHCIVGTKKTKRNLHWWGWVLCALCAHCLLPPGLLIPPSLPPSLPASP
jgi:hypothetical protein